MKPFAPTRFVATIIAAGCLFATEAGATTQSVLFDVLNATATLPTPLVAGDNLVLDTLVTSEVGALLQTINFNVGAGVSAFTGSVAWQISTSTGTGPRLIGVNIDIFDASNALVTSDAFAGTLAGFALSTFSSAIGPGSYKLVATGTGVRDSSLDLALEFTGAVPEPTTFALLIAGLAGVGFAARRRKVQTLT